MGKTPRQKELVAAYRARKIAGGICCVTCTGSGTRQLFAAVEPQHQRSRFQLALMTDTPLLPAMAKDWKKYGAECFTFEVLETIEKRADQSDSDFRSDLGVLSTLWRERLGGVFYT